MQKLKNQHLSEVFAYLAPEPEFNLFAIGDLEQFGMKDENVAGYTDDSWVPGTVLPYFLLNYRGNFLVYSHDSNYDAKRVGEFLTKEQPINISGKDDLIASLLPWMEERERKLTYLARLNQVTQEQIRKTGSLLSQVKRLKEEDIPAIYDLYVQIDEFAATYRNRPREICCQDIRMNVLTLGRSYGIYEQGKLVSIAQTSAENRRSAMVIGVATLPDFRRKGYARAAVIGLCQDCLSEGKEFLCLFYNSPAAGVIYHSIGFQDLGCYTMLQNPI